MSTLLLSYYINVRPLVGLVNHLVEIVNETIVLVCFWLQFLFTDYVEDPVVRHKLGYGMLYFISLGVGLSFLSFLYSVISKAIIYLRQRIAKRSLAQKIQKQNEAKQQARNFMTI